MAATAVPARPASTGQPDDMLAALHDWQDDPDYGDGAGAPDDQQGDSSLDQSTQPPGESVKQQAPSPSMSPTR